MNDQDSVQRLAEIRERAGEGIPEEAPIIDTYFEYVPYLLSLIDSLTAERDHERHRKEVAEFEREEVRTALTSAIEAADARAEAAEAKVKRLREALDLIAGGESLDAAGCARVARAALATPPSEGGQS